MYYTHYIYNICIIHIIYINNTCIIHYNIYIHLPIFIFIQEGDDMARPRRLWPWGRRMASHGVCGDSLVPRTWGPHQMASWDQLGWMSLVNDRRSPEKNLWKKIVISLASKIHWWRIFQPILGFLRFLKCKKSGKIWELWTRVPSSSEGMA